MMRETMAGSTWTRILNYNWGIWELEINVDGQKDYLAVLKITGDEKSSIYSDFDSENCF